MLAGGESVRINVSLVTLIVAAGGCVGNGGTTSVSSSSLPAPASSAAPLADFGSITGVVTDDESQPITSARVVIVETSRETDVTGRFTFNDVEPATLRVIVDRLGYESVAKRVEVRAGEVTEASFTLKAIAALGEPYLRTHTGSVFINADWWYTAAYFNPVADVGCERRCQIHHRIEPKPAGGLLETEWTPVVAAPLIAAAHTFQIYPNGDNGTLSPTSGTGGYVFRELPNRGQHVFTEDQTKLFAKANRTLTHVGAGFESVSFQQRVNVWITYGYVEAVPEVFTALPPK